MSDTAKNERQISDFMLMAEIAPTDSIRQLLLRQAEYCKIESRLIESSRSCLSESRELLKRVDALLSAQSAPLSFGRERSLQRNMLHAAVERVFDKWSDEKASPLPRSTSMH